MRKSHHRIGYIYFFIWLSSVVGYTDCCVSRIHVVKDADEMMRIRSATHGYSPCDAEDGQTACHHGGKCFINMNRDWYCVCAEGFVGERCDRKQLEHTYYATGSNLPGRYGDGSDNGTAFATTPEADDHRDVNNRINTTTERTIDVPAHVLTSRSVCTSSPIVWLIIAIVTGCIFNCMLGP